MKITDAVSAVHKKHAQPVHERTDALRCHECRAYVARDEAVRRHLLVRHASAPRGTPTSRRVLVAFCPRCATRAGMTRRFAHPPRPTSE